MLMLASPSREVARASSPGRCGSLTRATSTSVQVTRSASRTVLAVVGLSTTKRTRLCPTEGNAWKARMFTPRSASARQTFPVVPGRSSSRKANSLVVGMFVVLLHINVPGTQRAFLRNRNSPISTCQLPTSYVRPPSSRAAVASGRPWPSFLFLDVGHQGFGGQRQGGDRRGVQAGAGRAVAPDREGAVVVDRVRESKDENF